jgi:hypothetical protein
MIVRVPDALPAGDVPAIGRALFRRIEGPMLFEH